MLTGQKKKCKERKKMVMVLFKFTQHGNFIKSQNGMIKGTTRPLIKARCPSTTFQNKTTVF